MAKKKDEKKWEVRIPKGKEEIQIVGRKWIHPGLDGKPGPWIKVDPNNEKVKKDVLDKVKLEKLERRDAR